MDSKGNVCDDGTFGGTKLPNAGFLKEAGGYYTGSLDGVIDISGIAEDSGSVVGDAFAIVSSNGASFVFVDAVFKLKKLGENPGSGRRALHR